MPIAPIEDDLCGWGRRIDLDRRGHAGLLGDARGAFDDAVGLPRTDRRGPLVARGAERGHEQQREMTLRTGESGRLLNGHEAPRLPSTAHRMFVNAPPEPRGAVPAGE